MKHGSGRTSIARFGRRHGASLALLIGLVWVVGAAQAAPTSKWYAVSVTAPNPAAVAVDGSETFTVRLMNCSTSVSTIEPKCTATSSQGIGSANLYVPGANFSVTAPSGTATEIPAAGGTKTWTARHAGSGVVELRAKTSKDALAPGQSVSVNVGVTALGPLGSYAWNTVAKQANNFSGTGNDTLQLGSSPEVEIVTAVCKPGDQECRASDGGTTVQADVPPPGGRTILNFSRTQRSCGGVTIGTIGSLGIVEPYGYGAPLELRFTYDKSISGGANLNQLSFCLSKDDGATFFVLTRCSVSPTPPCEVSRGRTPGGHAEFIARIAPEDPWGGIG